MMKKQIIVPALAILFMAATVEAQESFRLDHRNSEITVKGTSSVHDWEMKATAMSAKIEVKSNGSGLDEIVNVSFSMPTEKLTSDNNIMNKKSWDALKSNKHDNIMFDLTSVSGFNSNGSTFSGTAFGTLTIAGKTKAVSIPFSGNTGNNNALVVSGEEKINMKDYNVSPPTAMLGTLKTGEEVTVDFNMKFIPESRYTELIN